MVRIPNLPKNQDFFDRIPGSSPFWTIVLYIYKDKKNYLLFFTTLIISCSNGDDDSSKYYIELNNSTSRVTFNQITLPGYVFSPTNQQQTFTLDKGMSGGVNDVRVTDS